MPTPSPSNGPSSSQQPFRARHLDWGDDCLCQRDRVATRSEFEQAAQDHPVATLETESGETVTTPLGAYVLVAEDGPLAGEGHRAARA